MRKYEVCYNEYRFEGESGWEDWSKAIEAHRDRYMCPFDGGEFQYFDTQDEAEAFVKNLSGRKVKDCCAALIYEISLVEVDEDEGEVTDIIQTIGNGAAAFGSRFFLQEPIKTGVRSWIWRD